ncbi:MAG: hypothetical protein KDJ77_04685, partial [Rhodobiaceae bacterium]|nr:hypothetical protein [Rhodobiaceae bacterium]
MRDIVTTRGTKLSVPEGVTVHDTGSAAVKRRSARRSAPLQAGTDASDQSVTDALFAGLQMQDVVATDEVVIEPDPKAPAAKRRSRRRAADLEPATLKVDLGPDELAVVLVERDGMLSWLPPDTVSKPRARRRGGKAAATGGTATFTIGAPPEAAGRRGRKARRGFLTDTVIDAILGPVRVHVLRFVAGKLVDKVRKRLEEKITPGLIFMDGNDPERWIPGEAVKKIPKLEEKRPLRILLMVHGTFSSTRGSFGALGLMPTGKAFLADARKHYDAIIGFDHSTLGATPMENATDIAIALSDLKLPKNTQFDAVGYSRGGLVLRSLLERVLVDAGSPYTFGKAIFVGCTNGGTALADPENWTKMLDLYTNLAVAASKTLAIFDGGTASRILTESIKTLGGFVQAVVDTSIVEGMVPGIEAMQPKSKLVADLNGPPPKPDPSKVQYYAIGTDFEPASFDGSVLRRGLPTALIQYLADGAVDQLMGENNDLVVDTEAMTQFGERGSRLVDKLFWDDNTVMYHTNYFQQPDVVKGIGGFLDLGSGPETKKKRPVVDVVTTVDVNQTIGEAVEQAETAMARRGRRRGTGRPAVVINRADYGKYVRSYEDLADAMQKAGSEGSILDSLDIHEHTAAEVEENARSIPDRIPRTGWVNVDRKGNVREAMLPPVLADRDMELEEAAPPPASSPRARSAPRRSAPRRSASRAPKARASRTRAPAPEPETRSAPAEVTCHFGAEMAEQPSLARPADLTVTVSREEIELVVGAARGTGKAKVKKDEPIRLSVEGRHNCEIVGTAETEVIVPDPGNPIQYDFKVKGLAAGPAEVWVNAHQGARRLTRIVLQPSFVATTGTIRAGAMVSTAEADPPMVEIRIREVRSSEGYRLNFIAQSRELDINLDRDSAVLRDNRDAYIGALYDRIEGDWGDNRTNFNRFMRKLRAMGASLYQEVVPEEIRAAIWKNRKSIGSIEVQSHEPFIPWEILYITDPATNSPTDDSKFLA